MIEQSFFYFLAVNIKNRFLHHWRLSLCRRFFAAFFGFLSGFWLASGTRHLFLDNLGLDSGFKGGLFDRAFGSICGMASWSSSKFSKAFENSRILSFVSEFCNDLGHISLRSYGLMFFIMGAIPAFVHEADIVFFAITMVGLVLMLVKKSVASIVGGMLGSNSASDSNSGSSSLLARAFGFFFISPPSPGALQWRDTSRYASLFLAFGLIFGIIAALTDALTFIMLVGAVFGTVLVIYKVEFGIFAAAFLMPIVPTMLTLGLLAITVLSFGIKAFIRGQVLFKFGLIDLFVALFGAIVAYSLVITYNFSSSLPVVMVYLLYILFYFVVKNTINTKKSLFGLLSTIAISGLFVAAFGIWQYVTGNFAMTAAWVDAAMFGGMTRIYSTLENPNVLGKYLIFIAMIAFAMLYYFKDNLHKLLAFGILGAAGLCMVLTQSRGAWLGLIFAGGIFALLKDRRLILLAIPALLAAPFFISPEVLGRFLSIGDLADTSTNFRLSIWLGSLDMLRVFWPSGIGLGPENFIMIYNMYAFSAAWALHSHNLFLQILIDLGIAGFITFMLIMIILTKDCFAASSSYGVGQKDTKDAKAAISALIACVLGFLLMGMTDNVWFNYRILAFFWLIVAIAASMANRLKEERL